MIVNVGLLLAAAAVTFLIGAVHSALGEYRVLRPLLSPATRCGALAESETMRTLVRVTWHALTLALWGLAAILVAVAITPADAHGTLALLIVGSLFAILERWRWWRAEVGTCHGSHSISPPG
ncbi:MAG: hypothetical protein HC841_06735 [Verrucomicrobiae bacterium]|nr:hypothetical protein [Verrucomicrobiae bacterium]